MNICELILNLYIVIIENIYNSAIITFSGDVRIAVVRTIRGGSLQFLQNTKNNLKGERL